jgi:hypothetical protein
MQQPLPNRISRIELKEQWISRRRRRAFLGRIIFVFAVCFVHCALHDTHCMNYYDLEMMSCLWLSRMAFARFHVSYLASR